MTHLIISLLVGIILGQRFKVAVLIPALACNLLMAIGWGVAYSQTVLWISLTAVGGAAALQVGYVGGFATRVTGGSTKPAAPFSSSHVAGGAARWPGSKGAALRP